MTTTLMKTCLLGMAGAMTFSLVACGNNSSSTGTPASTTVARSSTSVTASPTPVEHEQTKAPKHLSQDDFTKASRVRRSITKRSPSWTILRSPPR